MRHARHYLKVGARLYGFGTEGLVEKKSHLIGMQFELYSKAGYHGYEAASTTKFEIKRYYRISDTGTWHQKARMVHLSPMDSVRNWLGHANQMSFSNL